MRVLHNCANRTVSEPAHMPTTNCLRGDAALGLSGFQIAYIDKRRVIREARVLALRTLT